MSYTINEDDLLLIVLAMFFPPAAVWKRKGSCDKDTLLNFFLFLLFYFPGVIHACRIIYKTSKERDCESPHELRTATIAHSDLEAHPVENPETRPPAYTESDKPNINVINEGNKH
ncbi:CPS_collapsed_G0029410.mRNA.1.CDS.1 [Saccharomyces cerevisiae]|nr:CPS_collapsed_G0029410.mRNA.1.CDS.1 [Saccharomyces cerevisiae]